MKALKKLAAVLIFVLYSVSVFAQSLPVEETESSDEYKNISSKIYKKKGTKINDVKGSGLLSGVINFTGFSFKNYDPGKDSDLTKILEKDSKIIAENWAGIDEKYAVVGHSQGGVRALAYANVLKQKAEQETDPEMKAKYQHAYNHLGAVITVSGIDKGIKALEGGFGPIKSRIMEDVNILYNGIDALFHCEQILGTFLWDFSRLLMLTADDSLNLHDRNNFVDIVLGFFPHNMKVYLRKAMNECNPDEMKEIRDMMPYSDFIADNVADFHAEIKKVEDGGESVIEWRTKKIGWLRIPYFVKVYYPHYKVYTEYTENKLKLDDEIPVAYIVGKNNEVFSAYPEAEGWVTALKVTMGVTAGIHIVKSVCLVGLLMNSINYANYAQDAYHWLDNINDEIGERLGSGENDCVVAAESQFYSREAHPNVLSKDEKGYEEYPEFNHFQIDPTDNIDIQNKITELLQNTDVEGSKIN